MDYQLSPEETKLQENTATFCRDFLMPRSSKLDSSTREEACLIMRENIGMLAEAGCLEPVNTDGTIDLVAVYLMGEEIAKACPSTFLSARASTFLCAGALRLFGTPEQREQYVPALLKGEKIGAFAYSEEQAGSDLSAIASSARNDGTSWLINGRKNIVVNAPIADILLVLAYHDRDAGTEGGMSVFIVEKSSPGLETGRPVETMGLKGTPIASISMNDCISTGILGLDPGKGFGQTNRLLSLGTVGIAALCVGIGTACMEITTNYTKTRSAFGRRIGLHQDVGFKLADMFAYNDLGRMLALRASWAFNNGRSDAEELAACAKLFASEAATRIVNWGMQIFAGHGYLAGSDIERLYRDAKFGEICEGTSEMQRRLISGTELDRFAKA